MQIFIIYLLLGAILSVSMALTSKHPLPLGREIRAHVAIALFWPLVLFNIGRIYRKISQGKIGPDENSDLE